MLLLYYHFANYTIVFMTVFGSKRIKNYSIVGGTIKNNRGGLSNDKKNLDFFTDSYKNNFNFEIE